MEKETNIHEKIVADGPQVLGISELTAHIKGAMEANFPDVCVQGEISQFTCAASGHVYMTLKDDRSVLKAILWRSVARSLTFELEEGLEVICRGGIDVYPPRGSYQLIGREIFPCGAGSLQLAYKQLLKRLEKEGLFDKRYKKHLPRFPTKIGIVTSKTGAAVRDIIRVIRRRWPVATIYLLPTQVQGQKAAGQIERALGLLNERYPELDFIIAGRGGGSLEDLWAFNEECVARAIFASNIPVVSAVGHEVDFTVADFVADLRAATPSEAGEKTVPDRVDLLSRIDQLARRLARALHNKVKTGRRRLDALGNRRAIKQPETFFQDKIQRVDELLENIYKAEKVQRDRKTQLLDSLKARLEALSPQKVLQRGYSITFSPDGSPLIDAAAVKAGQKIETRLCKGGIKSIVEEA